MLVVHPHLHRRRTGVTRHVETVVTAAHAGTEQKALGYALSPEIPQILLGEVWRRARKEPVVWHAHRNLELLCGLLLRIFLRNLRVVFTRHTGAPPGAYTQWLSKRANERVALTASGKRHLAEPVSVVGHGVDAAVFTPPAKRSEAWQRLGLGGDRGLGVIGRIRPEKGQGDFLAAVAPLLEEHRKWTPVLVGSARPQHAAWLETARRPLRRRLYLAGDSRDIASWYRALTIVVHPSWSEGFSMVALEAMASGCCLVATKLEMYDGLVEDGVTGILYPPGDVEALRSKLEALMTEPERAEEIGAAARQWVQQRWTVEREVQSLEALYEKVSAAR